MRDHIKDFVVIDAEIIDNKPLYPVHSLRFVSIKDRLIRKETLYVHPLTGLLCKASLVRPKKVVAKDNNNKIIKSDLLHFERIKGVWYKMIYAKATWTKVKSLRTEEAWVWKSNKGDREYCSPAKPNEKPIRFYRVAKQQLSKKEIKKLLAP